MNYPTSINELIEYFKLLPGIGRRGAERMALALVQWNDQQLHSFGEVIASIPDKIGKCPNCGTIAAKGELCSICASPARNDSQICVVETVTQLDAVEKGNCFKGKYLVLGGRISPLDGEDGSSLNIDMLVKRAKMPETREVILALSSDVEGRATAAFLTEILADLPIKLTRPALGLPAGANLSYADAATIAAALSGRRTCKDE